MHHHLRYWMAKLPFDEPVNQALAQLLQRFLWVLLGFALLDMVTPLLVFGITERYVIVLTNVLLILIVLVSLWYLRRGMFQRALHLTILSTLLLSALVMVPAGLISSRAIFTLLAIPIVLAGLLATRRVLWLTTVVSVLLVVGLAVFVPPPVGVASNRILYDPVLTCVIFTMAAVLLSSVVGQVGDTLNEALRRVQHDESEARLRIRALQDSQADYRLMADYTSDLIALLDHDGRYVYASPSYARTLGFAPVSLIGTTARDQIHPDDVHTAADVWGQLHPDKSVQAHYRMIDASGTPRWFDVSLSAAVRDGDDYTVMVARDITARRSLELRLQQAQRLEVLGRLSGSVAHDFNTLLTVINGCASLAALSLPEDHPARAEVLEVDRASRQAMKLTRQLLTFARQQVFTPQVLALADVVGGMQRLLQRLLGETIQLTVDLSPDLWFVRGDAGQLEQVLLNMVTNARDAMPNGGSLTIVGVNRLLLDDHPLEVAAGAYVALTIADTGTGMTEDVQQRLFEPFFTTKGPEQGTGLGLATCYGIVTQLGGTITVTSTLGAGTTFTILLPSTDASLDGMLQYARGG